MSPWTLTSKSPSRRVACTKQPKEWSHTTKSWTLSSTVLKSTRQTNDTTFTYSNLILMHIRDHWRREPKFCIHPISLRLFSGSSSHLVIKFVSQVLGQVVCQHPWQKWLRRPDICLLLSSIRLELSGQRKILHKWASRTTSQWLIEMSWPEDSFWTTK